MSLLESAPALLLLLVWPTAVTPGTWPRPFFTSNGVATAQAGIGSTRCLLHPQQQQSQGIWLCLHVMQVMSSGQVLCQRTHHHIKHAGAHVSLAAFSIMCKQMKGSCKPSNYFPAKVSFAMSYMRSSAILK